MFYSHASYVSLIMTNMFEQMRLLIGYRSYVRNFLCRMSSSYVMIKKYWVPPTVISHVMFTIVYF